MRFLVLILSSLMSLVLVEPVFADAAATEKLSPVQLSKQLKTLNTRQRSMVFEAMTPNELKAKAESLLQDNSLSIVEKEFQLHEISIQLGRLPKTRITKALATNLQSYASQVKVSQQDGGHIQTMIAFPIAANARATQHHWQLQSELNKYYFGGVFNTATFMEALRNQPEYSRHEIVTLAVHKLQPVEREQLVIEIKQDNRPINEQDLIIIARATADSELFKRAIRQFSQTSATNIRPSYLTRLSSIWSEKELLDLLSAMLNSKVYPSLALQQMKDLKRLPADLRGKLLDLLSDRQLGGDAALVLAKHMDTEMLVALSQRLLSSDKVVSRRAILALKFSQSSSAKELLENYFMRVPNPALQGEVLK